MFTHLHVHSEYSLLDGMCRIPQLISRAKELGMQSLALTDHGVMYGAIEFYQAARAAGIKPIIGCELYVAKGSHLSHSPGEKENFHLVALAKDQTGYQNLIQLTTKAHLEGFYYKPRVNRELLEAHHEGLVALSACIGGEIPQLILQRRFEEARQTALWYKQVFKDFYLEIQKHPIPELEEINRNLVQMGNELNIPFIATNDIHYVNREDSSAHDLLLCIGTNTTVNDERRVKMAGPFFYMRSPQEMTELYPDLAVALENTGRIAEMCDLKLEFGRLHLPEIEIPAGKTPDDFLADICRQNLRRYYPEANADIEQRLDYELDVIKKTQFANYFLVVWDIISFVRKNNILFGVRGSAAASIVLHCLGITQVDPIENKLVFERFLNIERKEMPDIDLDFQDDRRDEVISYVTQRYGQDHVAQIISFGTLGARAAIRDVGRALGMTYGDVDRVARLVPTAPGMTLDRAMEENSELKSIYQQDSIVRNLILSAKRVEGIARHASTHAAGVVISKEPLTRYVPLLRGNSVNGKEAVMTQFAMGDIARIGLLKMDFLGLANLTILGKAREIIRQERGVDIDLSSIPLNDKKTFGLLSSGQTAGVFQLEGSGMRRYIKDLKPTTFSDIAAMVALYRPGPMEHIPTFIRAKHGLEPIRYPHPALASILQETYGVIVYQDQVLFIVRALAGYSLGQADIFRKAMGKKIAEVMQKEKHNFIAGAVKNGFSEQVAAEVFALIEPFAGYAFNKAHSVSYALIAYQTAYLKANFPAEYMTALLMSHFGQLEKVASAVTECRRLGIKILPPDINRSQLSFSIEKNGTDEQAIRFGLTAIKNVGQGAVEPIIMERDKRGGFKSLEELCRYGNLRGVNRRVLESLIKVGALDCLGNRGSLLNSVGRILSIAQRELQLRETGQSTMFDLMGGATPVSSASLELVPGETTEKEKSEWEKELIGVCLSKQPFSKPALKKNPKGELCGEINAELKGQIIIVVGEVVEVSQLLTRDRKPFVSAKLEDISGKVEVMVWPKVFADTKDLWQEGNILQVEGKVRLKEDDTEAQLTCERVSLYTPEHDEKTAFPDEEKEKESSSPNSAGRRRVMIYIRQTNDEQRDIDRLDNLMSILKSFPGEDEVYLGIISDEKVTTLRLFGMSVYYCPELHQRLLELVGEDSFKVQPMMNLV